MASRRIIIDPTHPAAMTLEQRRAELAVDLVAIVLFRHPGHRLSPRDSPRQSTVRCLVAVC